jgi:hypothetical protein
MGEDIDYKKKCEEYERRMGIGQYDLAKEGYLVLVNILRQQNEFLGEFKLKSKISSEEKTDAVMYKNAKDLWEGLPKMIESVGNLKIALKMEGEEKKSIYSPISAKEIANGNVSR